jgi:hypothetical protein
VAGLIFKKSLVWHVAYSAILTAGIFGGVAMVTAIGLVTFTLYIVTSAAHLLSLPGMAVLSCALVLLARDELSGSWDAFIWQKLKIATIKSCIRGSFTYQSGWLIAEMDTPQKAAFMRFIARLTHSKKPIRVVKVKSDDGEVFIVGWDVRPMPMRADGAISHPSGQSYRFEKHLFD